MAIASIFVGMTYYMLVTIFLSTTPLQLHSIKSSAKH